MSPDELWAQYYAKPDRELLRVYADALEQAGDPRGAFINLCLLDAPSDEQRAKKATLLAKSKKKLVGPGGAYLREIEFGRDGLVARARTEADKVFNHADAIADVNPRLVLTINSLKNQGQARALAGKLDRIWFVDFGSITSTYAINFNDKMLAALAPALANVRHLQLSLSANVENCFTPDGLRALGKQLRAIRYFALEYEIWRGDADSTQAAYAHAVADSFPPTLRGFDLDGIPLRGRPEVRTPGLLVRGKLAPAVRADLEHREFADQLDAALA